MLIYENVYLPHQLHNMSVHNLESVTQVQHLSLEYNGDDFTMTTKMLHDNVFNRSVAYIVCLLTPYSINTII